MELKRSTSGIPYIEFDENNRIDFRISPDNSGYTKLFIKAVIVTKIMSKDKKISFTKNVPQFYLTDLSMSPLPNKVKTTNKYFKAKNIKGIKDIIKKYVVDGSIAVNKINLIEEDLKAFNVK